MPTPYLRRIMHRLSNRLVAPRLRGRPLLAYPHQVPHNLSECRWVLAHQHALSARWLATDDSGSPLLPPSQIVRKQEKEYLSILGEESKGYVDPEEQQLWTASVKTNNTISSDEVSPSIVQEGMDMERGETSQESSQDDHEAYQYLSQLNKYYRDVHVASLKNAFTTEGILQEGKTLWTSTFICPVLGERIEAGKLPGTEECTELDGRYCYGKKKVAKQAAAMEAHVQLVQSKKFLEKAARTELELWYRRNHGGLFFVTDDSFDVRKEYLKGEGVGGDWWTASFTCPASGEKYLAATLKDTDAARRDPDGSCTWYRETAEARTAIVSWVLDIKRFRETGMSEPRTCEEDPSMLDNTAAFISTTTSSGMDQEQSLEDSLRDNFACRALIEWYQQHHDIEIRKDSFVSTMSTLNALDTGTTKSWWTSSFLCPVSGVRYDAGKLKEYSPDELIYDSDGGIWYKQEGVAVAAAALRAIESLRSVTSSDVEAPEFSEAVPSSRSSPAKVDVASTTTVLSTTSHEDDRRQADKTKAIGDIENDYIIQNVSSSSRVQGLGSPQNMRGPTILSLIAETWAEVSSPQDKTQDSSPRVSTERPVMPRYINPVIARQKAIDTALQWVEKHRSKHSRQNGGQVLFNLDHGLVSLQIANMLLDSLATAAARLPFDTRQSGVEVAATALVEMMWSSKSAQPNAETYASYLKCFEGDDPVSVALRAQEMLDAMNNETEVGGRILPHPSTAVTNAVIQLWARVGGSRGRFGLNDNVTPNRDTILSMLSSMSFPATVDGETAGFDADYARECIDRMMKELEKTGDVSFVPDIQVYNAGLRWSGGQVLASSRQYAPSQPWDIYHEIFQNGFQLRGTDDPLVLEATAMENWLRAMELPESRVSPDIETYESVIQAWIRTGTQDGLMKAEALGNRLIEGTGASLQPRVQTFHPILSAWIYSSVDGAPEKVAEWLDRLDDLPDMVMDGRLLAAPIKVCIADQRRLLEPWKSCEKHLDASKTKDEVIKRAKQSSLCLAELVERLKHDSDFFLEADAFTLAIQAWYNASVLNAGDSSQGQYDFLLVEAQDIVRDFNDLIALLSSSAELPGRESRARQVRHLVESSPRVYSGAILCLRKCQELELESRPSNSHPQARQAVEKMFSRFTELRAMDPLTKNVENSRLPVAMIDQQYRKSSNDDCSDWMLYDDMFHYSSLPFLDKSLAETRIELLSQLFHLAEVSESLFEHDGDLVELCAGAAESLVYREMRESKPPSVGTSPEYINLLKEVRKTHLGKTYVILERLIRDLETNTKERARRMKN